jgi:hypothetical protein
VEYYEGISPAGYMRILDKFREFLATMKLQLFLSQSGILLRLQILVVKHLLSGMKSANKHFHVLQKSSSELLGSEEMFPPFSELLHYLHSTCSALAS